MIFQLFKRHFDINRYKFEKRWANVFQIYSNAIHFNPFQFCPFLSLLSFPVFCLSSSIVLSRYFVISVNSMTTWSILKLPKIAWPSPFNAPAASHMGGVWERLIRTVRSVLSVLLQEQGSQLHDEALHSLMREVESVIDSRPLTVENLSEHGSPEPITPNHLLTSKTSPTWKSRTVRSVFKKETETSTVHCQSVVV